MPARCHYAETVYFSQIATSLENFRSLYTRPQLVGKHWLLRLLLQETRTCKCRDVGFYVLAKHQLRHPPAYAIDKEHIDKLAQQSGWGVELVTVKGEVWVAPLGQFLLNGINLDRGEGKQVALPLQYWTRQDGRQMSFF